MPEALVVDVPERSRFEIRVGEEVAGFTEYRRRPELIAIVRHTEHLDLVPEDVRAKFDLPAHV